MAGNLFLKERGIITLTSSGSSLTASSGAAAATDLDTRAGGNAPDDWAAMFELVCQWATITGIAAGTIVADLYLVPLVDGTNLPDVDLTSGAAYIPYGYKVASFSASKAPTANTNMRFASPTVFLDQPALYRPHIINRSGQAISSAWTLKSISTQGQYS